MVINYRELHEVCFLEYIWSHLSKSGKVTLSWNIVNQSCVSSSLLKIARRHLKAHLWEKLVTNSKQLTILKSPKWGWMREVLPSSFCSLAYPLVSLLFCWSFPAACRVLPGTVFGPQLSFYKRMRHFLSHLSTCSFYETLFTKITATVQCLM